MKYYPIGLDITKKRCIVIGGGEIAERKACKLAEYGADVVVIARVLTHRLQEMTREGRIEHINADYEKDHIRGAFLIIGATDRQEVNGQIARDGRAEGILVNIADDPPGCDFILPALLERGDLVIAVLTGGKSPALAKRLRMEFEESYGPEYQILLEIMGDLRSRILARGGSSGENKRLFEAVINSDILQHIRDKRWDYIKEFVKRTTGEDIEVGK